MRPLYPAIFSVEECLSMKWALRPENVVFKNYIFSVCKEFPSLILTSSAAAGLSQPLAEIAESLISSGINVFMPPDPTPICALSQALSSRSMQLGLYLDCDEKCQNLTLTALANHGGPPDERDVTEEAGPLPGRTGVAGTTEVERYYASNISGLADRFIESGAGFRSIKIPFTSLEERLRSMPELQILFESDREGPQAAISDDGQVLILTDKNGVQISAKQIVSTIAEYLVKERHASGAIVGPEAVFSHANAEDIETVKVEGSLFDMNYHAGYANLLLGWWDNGAIAHQGSSPFGDAILTAIYYLEALRSPR